MSEFLKSLATPPVGSAVPAGGTVAALALAQAAALLTRTGGGDGGSWLHGLRLAEQDAFAVRTSDLDAWRPPADVITAAASVLATAERRLPEVSGAALLDVAAAAEAVRSAVVIARVAIESRTGSVPALEVDELVSRAERITEAVRSGLTNQLVG
ncbi:MULTISPECIES: hypothetical protein [unclassified Amycolatopsis]|uniref:hypothetical protein n=1 Tax=unclassified Amycolatopsis TaxID=2618356 RepID=UPI0021021995|nr:hypothetical protein [Amycolatopsis sp. DSM 110486]